MSLLDAIDSPRDLKKLTPLQLVALAEEIRSFLLSHVSQTGGHLASNLGAVELTMALHYCFHAPWDKMVWDVGHQAYVHKILTGRKEEFQTLRQIDGLSGFPKRRESQYDAFGTGHSSTSISAALGLAKARDLREEQYNVIAVIGDGAMTGGLAYEALNNAGRNNTNLIVVLNDNQMSISPNVGALSRHLNDIRTEEFYLDAKQGVHHILDKIPVIGKPLDRGFEQIKNKVKYLFIPGILFEEMGFTYIGPIYGHSIEEMTTVFQKVKKLNGPVLVHVRTVKGKGYAFAEQTPAEFHGVGPFQVETGTKKQPKPGKSYSQIFGETLLALAKQNKNIVAISAAMTEGTGLTAFQQQFPERFFDVGIAEQHAVTFAAGLACSGFRPVFAVYSTFLQRAYDQVLHDVALQNLPVVFAIDRAGIVGADGETHQGIYDVSFLSHIPNMTVMAPKNGGELEEMLRFALNEINGPAAIRYPRENDASFLPAETALPGETVSQYKTALIRFGKGELLQEGKEIAILSAGERIQTAWKVANRLKADGYEPMVINLRFLKPLDEELLLKAAKQCALLAVIEDQARWGGTGEAVLAHLQALGVTDVAVECFAFPDAFIPQGTREELFLKYSLDEISIYCKIKEILIEMDGNHGGKGTA